MNLYSIYSIFQFFVQFEGSQMVLQFVVETFINPLVYIHTVVGLQFKVIQKMSGRSKRKILRINAHLVWSPGATSSANPVYSGLQGTKHSSHFTFSALYGTSSSSHLLR